MKQAKRQKANRRHGRARRQKRAALTAFIVVLALIMLALAGYVGWWYIHRGRVQADSQRYAELYGGRDHVLVIDVTAIPTAKPTAEPTLETTPAPTSKPTAEPASVPTAAPTAEPTEPPTPAPTAEPTPTPTSVPTTEPTPEPTPEPTEVSTAEPFFDATVAHADLLTIASTPAPTAEPTPEPTVEPTLSPTSTPLNADMPVVEDAPIPTPDAHTQVFALPTPPPVQPGFAKLLSLNPETVGFLEIDGMLSLPVVQRENDNEFYLTHGFEGGESREGALFLDGLNRLVPEDDCLLVYGHNMKNNTMFGRLDRYEDLAYLRQHSVLHFDTLYENRAYVAFAAFTASMDSGSSRYFDVRQFIFDDVEFDKFVLKLESRSRFRIPVDVQYGDHLLLLVTCDYTNKEGRFILALRQLREDETEAGVWAQAMQATEK